MLVAGVAVVEAVRCTLIFGGPYCHYEGIQCGWWILIDDGYGSASWVLSASIHSDIVVVKRLDFLFACARMCDGKKMTERDDVVLVVAGGFYKSSRSFIFELRIPHQHVTSRKWWESR